MKEFYTVTEAAERLGVSRQAIYGWIHMGWIDYSEPGKLSASDLEVQRQRMVHDAWDGYMKAASVEPLSYEVKYPGGGEKFLLDLAALSEARERQMNEATVENSGSGLWS